MVDRTAPCRDIAYVLLFVHVSPFCARNVFALCLRAKVLNYLVVPEQIMSEKGVTDQDYGPNISHNETLL